jgi:hypothetical protein
VVVAGAQRGTDAAAARHRQHLGAGLPGRVRRPVGARVVDDQQAVDDLARRAAQPAFRAAAIRDGAAPASGRGFPTTYPNPDSFWQEYFAEVFMLYQTSPDLLQRNRPNVYAFMLATFPR